MKTFTYLLLIVGFCWLSTASAQTNPAGGRKTANVPNHTVQVTNMGNSVNSSYDDFAPVIHGNGRLMFLTSTRSGNQDIFTTANTGGRWGQATPLGSGFNTDRQEGSACITPDGHWMVFTRCDESDGEGDCDLYIAEYVAGVWTNVHNMGSDINSPDWESQPSITADGLKLFFTSNRPGGMGGTDIWMCERLTGGEWSEPINLGSDVNTADDEMSPYIAQDNRSLYFASNGHPGLGGYDIYVTRGSGRSWTKPENLGTPVNSEYDDEFFDPMVGTTNAFMVSDRPGGDGRLDVYAVVPNPLPPDAVTMVVGTVSDAKTKVPVGATLTVRDIESGDEISSFHSDDVNGNYVVVLQRGKTYVITAEAAGYLFYSDRFEVLGSSDNRTLRKDISLSSETVRLLVYFDFDKSTLKRESTVDLKRAIKWLRDNPTLTIELAGHTDNKGTVEYNKKLSQDRANAVLEFLASKGADRSRMTAKGCGFDEPVASNDTDDGRALNRRVEFRIKK